MKFALVLCIAALGSPNFQAHGHHHLHHHHSEHHSYPIAQVYAPQESIAVVRPSIHHEYFKSHHGTHHVKDNVGATLHTSYSGTAFQHNQEGQPECMGSYSGSNIFVQPASGQYNQFAMKCKSILKSLLEFISKPVEFGCSPGSALNLDLQSRIVNHKLPCETICLSEGDMVPVLEDKVLEVPVPISSSDCAPEVYPVGVHPHVSECNPCNTQSVQVVPVEVAPVREPVQHVHLEQVPVREPVHHVHLEPAIVPTRHVVYEQPIVKTEMIPEDCEEDPKETKHQIHELQKQLHHMLHNQKKHYHHHHH